ncbi:hypothetical protein ACEK06_12645 [Pseudomonas brenneri]|uniref:Uncharacterized protein n=1 Tax=Pseudomonas sivasensis TaxID=1880678 RepID=A0ABW8E1B4_9PSED
MIKWQFGETKVRFHWVVKNAAPQVKLFDLSNLHMSWLAGIC